MAQTKRKRRRKHRGTQTGKVDRRPRGRPRNRSEARARARSGGKRGRGERPLNPPTWRGAILKGGLAAGIFFALLALAFGRPPGGSLLLAGFMMLFYVPMTYYTDGFFYKRRLRQAEQARLERAERGVKGE
jgi:hypothetical protein